MLAGLQLEQEIMHERQMIVALKVTFTKPLLHRVQVFASEQF